LPSAEEVCLPHEEKEVAVFSDFSFHANHLCAIYVLNSEQALWKDLAMLTKLPENLSKLNILYLSLV